MYSTPSVSRHFTSKSEALIFFSSLLSINSGEISSSLICFMLLLVGSSKYDLGWVKHSLQILEISNIT